MGVRKRRTKAKGGRRKRGEKEEEEIKQRGRKKEKTKEGLKKKERMKKLGIFWSNWFWQTYLTFCSSACHPACLSVCLFDRQLNATSPTNIFEQYFACNE